MKNTTALITGAARGIGKVTALFLAKEGANIILNDIDEEAGQQASQEIQSKTGAKVSFIKANVAREKEVKDMISVIEKEFTNLHILVNNAGILSQEGIEETSLDSWQKVLEINLTGAFLCCQYVAEAMKEQGGGKIVNISSISGIIGSATQVHYCSSKGGENMLTKSLAIALAPYRINVNAVLPGTIITDTNREYYRENPELEEETLERTPLKRFGSPADIAEVVAFLCSEKADWITGSLWPVDGGFVS